MPETRLQEMLRLQAEIAEREARLKHVAWQAEQAGEVRIKLVAEAVTDCNNRPTTDDGT